MSSFYTGFPAQSSRALNIQPLLCEISFSLIWRDLISTETAFTCGFAAGRYKCSSVFLVLKLPLQANLFILLSHLVRGRRRRNFSFYISLGWHCLSSWDLNCGLIYIHNWSLKHDLVSHSTYIMCVDFINISGGTYSLKLTPKDSVFLRNCSWPFYLLTGFWPEIIFVLMSSLDHEPLLYV